MTTLIRVDPYREAKALALQGEMNRFLNLLGTGNGSTTPSVWAPPLDVWETDDEIVYAFDLPGIPKDTVSIEFENDLLTVSAERERSQEVSTDRLYRFERRYGSFSRTIGLPPGVAEGSDHSSLRQRRARSPRQEAYAKEAAPGPDQQRQGRNRGQSDESLREHATATAKGRRPASRLPQAPPDLR